MTQQEYSLALSQLIQVQDNTIEDSPDTDTLIVAFEEGGEL